MSSRKVTSPTRDPYATIGFALKQAQQALRTRLDAELSEIGLTTPQYAVLAFLDVEAGASNAALARRAFVTPPDDAGRRGCARPLSLHHSETSSQTRSGSNDRADGVRPKRSGSGLRDRRECGSALRRRCGASQSFCGHRDAIKDRGGAPLISCCATVTADRTTTRLWSAKPRSLRHATTPRLRTITSLAVTGSPHSEQVMTG